MNENLVNLARLLQFHDWHFNYSDDHSVWKRGMAERDNINQEQRRLLTSGLATIEEILELTHKYAPKT
jgi:hypothetical protein